MTIWTGKNQKHRQVVHSAAPSIWASLSDRTCDSSSPFGGSVYTHTRGNIGHLVIKIRTAVLQCTFGDEHLASSDRVQRDDLIWPVPMTGRRWYFCLSRLESVRAKRGHRDAPLPRSALVEMPRQYSNGPMVISGGNSAFCRTFESCRHVLTPVRYRSGQVRALKCLVCQDW